MEAPLCIVCLSILASLPFLYILWKRHPSYGANPGPPVLPLVGCVPFILFNKHRLHEWTSELFDRAHSLTIRIAVGPSVMHATADPAAVRHILKARFADYPKGHGFYPYFAELLGNGIFNCDGALWRLQRKVASYVFTSSSSLRDFVVAIVHSELSHRLLPGLESVQQNCRNGDGVVDLQALLMDCTFDIICQLTFGSDPACLNVSQFKQAQAQVNCKSDGACDDDVSQFKQAQANCKSDGACDDDVSPNAVPHHLVQEFVHAFHVALQACADRFLLPGFVWKFKRAFRIGSERKLVNALQAVNEFTSCVIEQSKKDIASGKDCKHLLARFLRLSNNGREIPSNEADMVDGDGSRISDSLLRDILLCFILAGQETVAAGVTFTMWLLSVHSRVEKKVLNEINSIVDQRRSQHASQDSEAEMFTYDELRNMNYLQAVLSESMRLYPPVPSTCKYAVRDDTFPDGTRVLKGDRVSYNAFAMGRAVKVWGKDCYEFRPERWLNNSGTFVPVSPFEYPVFQAGPRICLGKDFAFIQMKLVVASLMKNFEFSVEPGFQPKLSYGVTSMFRDGLPVTVRKRLVPL